MEDEVLKGKSLEGVVESKYGSWMMLNVNNFGLNSLTQGGGLI